MAGLDASDANQSELAERLLQLLEAQVEDVVNHTDKSVRVLFDKLERIDGIVRRPLAREGAESASRGSHAGESCGSLTAVRSVPSLQRIEAQIDASFVNRMERRRQLVRSLHAHAAAVNDVLADAGGESKCADLLAQAADAMERDLRVLSEALQLHDAGESAAAMPTLVRSIAREILEEAGSEQVRADEAIGLLESVRVLLGEALAELQFQDTVRQKLEGAVRVAGGIVQHGGGMAVDPVALRDSYTMDSQRRIHDAIFGAPSDEVEATGGPPIQLF